MNLGNRMFPKFHYMSQFADEFTHDEFVQQPAAQIPWFTIVKIMQKSNTHDEMLWYINSTYQNGWSRCMVLNQIEMKAYERSLIKPSTTAITKQDESINEIFKDTYVFDFLDKEVFFCSLVFPRFN